MINEFIAKKLGEVLAFAEVGIETLERGQEGFASVLGKSAPEKMLETNKEHSALLKKIAADDKQFGSVTLAKSIKTGEKLRKMRDLYVGDEWDNGVELLEWSGFFEGAALVHWQLHGYIAWAYFLGSVMSALLWIPLTLLLQVMRVPRPDPDDL